MVNDTGIGEDFPTEDLEVAIIGIVWHELAHMLDRPALYDERDCDDPERLKFDALVLTDDSQRAARIDLPVATRR